VVAAEVGEQARKQMHLQEQQEVELAEQHFKNTQLPLDSSLL
jgi:hypothetical protein